MIAQAERPAPLANPASTRALRVSWETPSPDSASASTSRRASESEPCFAFAAHSCSSIARRDSTCFTVPTGRVSGLVEAMKVVGSIEGISFVYFDDRDVVRHKLVQQIVKAYEAFTNGNGRS